MSWWIRCGDGTPPGPGSGSISAMSRSPSGRRRRPSRSTTTPGPATRAPTAPVSWSGPNESVGLAQATLDVHLVFDRPVDQLPLPALLDLQPHVGPDRDRAQLPLQLAMTRETARLQRPALECRDDGAAGLGVVPAIGEAAAERQIVDVREDLCERLRAGPELDLP